MKKPFPRWMSETMLLFWRRDHICWKGTWFLCLSAIIAGLGMIVCCRILVTLDQSINKNLITAYVQETLQQCHQGSVLCKTESIRVFWLVLGSDSSSQGIKWSGKDDVCFLCGFYLYKSMPIWYFCSTCWQWVFYSCKPQPFWNKHHSICYDKNIGMFHAELLEGNDE